MVAHIVERPEVAEMDRLIDVLAERLQWTALEVEQARVVGRGDPDGALQTLRLLVEEVHSRHSAYEETDDRISCTSCVRHDLSGHCGAWRELGASNDYRPVSHPPRRCEAYLPMPSEPDQRTGRERWPGYSSIPVVKVDSAEKKKR